MPLGRDSQYETVALVLTKAQVRRLRALKEAQETPRRAVSISEIGREVIEMGLNVILHVPNTDFHTSLKMARDGIEEVA